MRLTYRLIPTAEDAALFIKACFFPLSLTAEESARIAKLELLSRTLEILRESTMGTAPAGAREFLGAYYAGQAAHQVAVTERATSLWCRRGRGQATFSACLPGPTCRPSCARTGMETGHMSSGADLPTYASLWKGGRPGGRGEMVRIEIMQASVWLIG